MKHFPSVALFIVAAISVVPGALAQNLVLKADVPFSFIAGESRLPAGEYIFSSPGSGLVQIRGVAGQGSATVVAPKGYNETKGDPKLVFDKYGSLYFLHRILCPSSARMNVEIPAWKLERRVRSREAKNASSEQILVAAR